MSVKVTKSNGNIGGLIADDDGTVGIIMTGATEGTVTAGTPFLVTNKAGIEVLSLTTANNALAVKFFNEVIAETALLGLNEFKLYVLLVASTTTVDDMCDVSNNSGAKKLVDFANGAIRHLFALSNDTLVYPSGTGLTTDNGINEDCYTAITNMKALIASYAALPNNWPMRGCVGGTSFTGTATDVTDQTENTANTVQLIIGDTVSGDGCALGIVAGRRMALPVQRKLSRVKNGPISSTTAFIGSTSADAYLSTSTLTGKGIVTFKKITNYTGFYFTGDNTCCPTTDDYHVYPRGSVIDKAHRIIVDVYNNEIDDEVDTNDDGTIDAGAAKTLQTLMETAGKENMVAFNNCKEVNANVSTSQNVATSGTVGIEVNVKGRDYQSKFDVTVGLKPVTS